MTVRSVLERVAYALALPFILLTIWWVVSADSQNFFWPPLQEILAAFPETWFGGRMTEDVLPSLARLAVGYLLAVGLGVAIGLPIGLSRRLRAYAEPTLEFFRAIPPPVIVPVIALFSGYTGSLSKIITIVIGCIWPVLLNTVEGVRAVDEVLLDTAKSYHLSRRSRILHVVLRSASPQIAAGARQALSIAVILLVISELFGASRGLGATIVQFQRSFAVVEMWTGIIMLGLIGVLLSVIFRLVENRALAWYRGLRDADRGA
jgi:ABC-type nitrate/sulfonate/bicarbonate transport system permease component